MSSKAVTFKKVAHLTSGAMPGLPSSLTDKLGMPMTAGGIPFMCYKVQRIARLAQPAPEGGQPLLLSLPPGPPAGGLSLNDAPDVAGASPGSAAYYGVWPSSSPATAQLFLDIFRYKEQEFMRRSHSRLGYNFLWEIVKDAFRAEGCNRGLFMFIESES